MVMARSAGIGSHRYSFHFTGDTYCQWPVLKSSVEYMLRAGHIGQSFITHDIGGHIGYGDGKLPEDLYLRWVQFGVLSPICRLHSAGGERRPWKYSATTQQGVRASIHLRNRLVPYLYTLAWQAAETGVPICRSNPLEVPDWEAGYAIWDRYFIGDRLYAAPILEETGQPTAILPPGEWFCGLSGRRITSDGVSAISLETDPTQAPPHFFKAGSVLVLQPEDQPVSELPARLDIHCFFTEDGRCDDAFTLYEDDGLSTAHEAGENSLTEFACKTSADGVEFSISPLRAFLPVLPQRRDVRIHLHAPIGSSYRHGDAVLTIQNATESPVHFAELKELQSAEPHSLKFERLL